MLLEQSVELGVYLKGLFDDPFRSPSCPARFAQREGLPTDL